MRTSHFKQLFVGARPSQPMLSWLQTWVFSSLYDSEYPAGPCRCPVHWTSMQAQVTQPPFQAGFGQVLKDFSAHVCFSLMLTSHHTFSKQQVQVVVLVDICCSGVCKSTQDRVHLVTLAIRTSCPCCSVPFRIPNLGPMATHSTRSLSTEWFQLGRHAEPSRRLTSATLGG